MKYPKNSNVINVFCELAKLESMCVNVSGTKTKTVTTTKATILSTARKTISTVTTPLSLITKITILLTTTTMISTKITTRAITIFLFIGYSQDRLFKN